MQENVNGSDGTRTRDLRRDRPIQAPEHSRANDDERAQPCAFQAFLLCAFGLANRARSETFGLISLLALERAAYITGQNIRIDGGITRHV
jgi:hypothetical protein